MVLAKVQFTLQVALHDLSATLDTIVGQFISLVRKVKTIAIKLINIGL